MVGSENSTDDCKFPKISFSAIIKIPEFGPDHFKTKIMCKKAVKNLHFVTRYLRDQ